MVKTHVFPEPPTWQEFLAALDKKAAYARIEPSPALDRHFRKTYPNLWRTRKEAAGWEPVADADDLPGDLCYFAYPAGPSFQPITLDRKTSRGKLMMHLVTSDLVRQAAAADTYGAEKYGEPGSWRNAPTEDVYRYVDAAERHLSDVKAALVEGRADRWLAPDSQLSHLAHLAATVGILIEFARRMGLDLPEEFDRRWEREEFEAKVAKNTAKAAAHAPHPDATGTP